VIVRRLEFEWRRARRFAGEQTVETTLAILRALFGLTPIPVRTWKRAWSFNRLIAGRTLARSVFRLDLRTDHFPPEVARVATVATLTPWSIDAETARWLWREARLQPPRVVLECGSGESTVLFAALFAAPFASARANDERGMPPVVSLDQSADYAAGTRARIDACGWAHLVDVLVAPLGADANYIISPSTMTAALGSRRADWIFIDGPSGYRTGTVPSLAAFARTGTRWFLDDAFEPAYFAAVEAWSTWPGLRVDGIVPIGKGLAVGTITDPAAASAHRDR
jgi:hypothetical protein